MAIIGIKIVLIKTFSNPNNADILFLKYKLSWKSYIAIKALPTIKQIELIDRKKFAKAILDKDVKPLIKHITFSISLMLTHLAKKAQIALLLTKKILILRGYSDFINVFYKHKALILLKIIKFNQYTIKLLKPSNYFISQSTA